jgi:hypothetical protein
MLFMQEESLTPENRIQLFIYYVLGARTASFFVGLSTFTYGVSAIMNKRLLWLVLADSSYIKDVHSGERTQEQAQTFVQQIKDNSDGQAPFFESDGWFYEEVLTQVYGTIEQVPYKGRGRKPLPKKYLTQT